MTNLSNNQPFFKLSPSMTKKLRESSLTASDWKLWSYLVTLDPFGDRYVQMPDVDIILDECGISKTAFYRAKAKLLELDLFEFQVEDRFRNLTTEKLHTPEYQRFLQSDYWKAVRELVLERDKHCQSCTSTKKLQVHHLTYDHHKDELNHLNDLVTLCDNCHKQVHNIK